MFIRVRTQKPHVVDVAGGPRLRAGIVISEPDEKTLHKLQPFIRALGAGRHEFTRTWPVMGGMTFTISALDLVDRALFEVLEEVG
ncbi:MAG: hypothetical protein AB7E79_09630 [Rhodospirillaceae bacterium]